MSGRLGLAVAIMLSGAMPASSQQAPASAAARLDHVALWVHDQPASVAFYQEIFGLKEIPSPFPPGGPRWLGLAGGAELHIQPGRPQAEPVGHPWRMHFAVAVASLDPVMAYLKAHGRTWYDSSQREGQVSHNRTDGVAQIFFQDPDGYWIEVNDAAGR